MCPLTGSEEGREILGFGYHNQEDGCTIACTRGGGRRQREGGEPCLEKDSSKVCESRVEMPG